MKLNVFQKGFSYSQDGDGNRLVCHLQGCNMRCRWCSNPEGLTTAGALLADEEWLADALCPKGAICNKRLDRRLCADCADRECVSGYSHKGLRLSCETLSVAALLEEIRAAAPLFYGGGGVTFTGGEPTLQFDALKALLRSLKENKIHTAIETNGSHPALGELFPLIDQLIIDCKQCDDEKHRAATGISNRQILENLRRAASEHPRVHIRVPLIGGVNDSDEDLAAFTAFFKTLRQAHTTFEILPYHEFGAVKWKQCGYTYEMTGGFVADETVQKFRAMLTQAGLNYRTT